MSQYGWEHDGQQAQLWAGTLDRDTAGPRCHAASLTDVVTPGRESRTRTEVERPLVPAPAARPAEARPVILTGRGAVLLMVTLFAIGSLAASWLGWTRLAGIAFLLGSCAAARYTKPADLLTVVVTPPLLFFCALIGVRLLTGGSPLVSVLGGSLLTLTSVAPWLFVGAALNLIISWWRGLGRCIAELRRAVHPRPIRPAARRR